MHERANECRTLATKTLAAEETLARMQLSPSERPLPARLGAIADENSFESFTCFHLGL